MNRLDVYTAVHKMQRARLFDLTVAAGKADGDDTVTTARLARAVGALAGELTSHAEHEDRFIHPLLRATAPTLAGSDQELFRDAAGAVATTPDRTSLFRRHLESVPNVGTPDRMSVTFRPPSGVDGARPSNPCRSY
jgi:hypothetical protein